jgi:hypothetical protein
VLGRDKTCLGQLPDRFASGVASDAVRRGKGAF